MMKKMMMTAVLTMIVVAVQAMSFTQARQEALFLSDKMAYELHLTMDQYEAVYEINLDYFLSIRYADDVFGVYWNRRNTDLRFVLNTWQYRRYVTTVDFYQPTAWRNGGWTFNIYMRYDRGNHFRQPPTIFNTYLGGRNRGTISFYQGRTINKPSDRHVGNGRSWNTQPSNRGNNGNNHFSQPGNGNRPNGYQPGTNNRQNNQRSTQPTRRFGTGGSQTSTQPKPATGNQGQQKAAQQQPTRKVNAGNFGGKR